MISLKNIKIDIKAIALLTLITGAASFLAYYYSINMPYFTDDFDILMPAINHMKGAAYPTQKYPTFPFMFYEFFLTIISAITPVFSNEGYIHTGRMIAVAIFAANIILFYHVARLYLERYWAILCLVLYICAPVIFYSGIVVKTESLLLAELFLCLISAEKILAGRNNVGWHAAAALSCGLAISTKYNVMLLAVYVTALLMATLPQHGRKILPSAAALARDKKTWIFAAVFIAAILSTWTTIWDMKKIIEYSSSDLYVLPRPTPLRAVDEFWSFPYGRYSYALLTIIPFGAGLFNYSLAMCAMAFRQVPRKLLILWGGFVLLYFIFSQSITLSRPPYMFTPIVPFLIVSAALFLRYFFVENKNYILKTTGGILLSASLIFSLLQFPALFTSVKGMVEAFRSAQDLGKDVVVLIHAEYTEIQGINYRDIEGSINSKKPGYILTLDSYFYNFGKYSDPELKKQYAYYERLARGRTDYMIEWQRSLKIPFKSLFFDPELSFTYTLFKRGK